MYKEVTNLKNWNDLEKLLDSLDSKWIFRGQQDYSWALNSTMDRLILPFAHSQLKNKKMVETLMIRELTRKVHLYDNGLNSLLDSNFQKISFLQHYGAPTRLIDFSYSPYVALFFAIENSRADSALFAFNSWEILRDTIQITKKQKARNFNLSDPNDFNKVMLSANQKKCVGMVQPFLMFDRINSQSGCFLCQGDIHSTFEENLETNFKLIRKSKEPFYKIRIPNSMRNDCITKLRRMNINRSTLFPDIEGFIRSISMKVIVDILRH